MQLTAVFRNCTKLLGNVHVGTSLLQEDGQEDSFQWLLLGQTLSLVHVEYWILLETYTQGRGRKSEQLNSREAFHALRSLLLAYTCNLKKSKRTYLLYSKIQFYFRSSKYAQKSVYRNSPVVWECLYCFLYRLNSVGWPV